MPRPTYLPRLTPAGRDMASLVLNLLACEPCGLNRLTQLTGATGDSVKVGALARAIDSLRRSGAIRLEGCVFVLVAPSTMEDAPAGSGAA